MAPNESLGFLRQRPAGRLAAKIFHVWRAGGITGLRWRLRLLREQTQGYSRWLQEQELRDAAERDALATRIGALAAPPLISLVLPVCDPPEPWLRRAIDSVLTQIYPRWQLCIADDASTAAYVRPMLQAAAGEDARVQVTFREARGHICAATRTALAMANGRFITFLDHDDELSSLALARIADEIDRHPEADLLYSDEDLIGTDGRRYDPYFKPDWNPELLRAQNYLCHLSAYRADLLQGLDAFRPEVQGSQDWDLALRASERARCIRHLPHVLYHWRSAPGSTAHSDTAKSYALQAGQHAVQNHLTRCGDVAEARLLPFGHLCVRHALPTAKPSVSLVVAEPEAEAITKRLAALLRGTRYSEIEILVATARSGGETTLPDGIRLVDAAGENIAQRLNAAAAAARGDILCFIDGRCEAPDSGWLETLAAEAARQGIGAVGARLLLADGSIWHAGYLLDPDAVVLHLYRGAPAAFAGQRNRALLQQNVSAVSTECLAVRRKLFEQVGGFDTTSGCFFDTDFCLRLLEAGLRNVWTPHATLVLHARPEREPDEHAVRYMQARWSDVLGHDPAGNPNVSLVCGLPVPRRVRP